MAKKSGLTHRTVAVAKYFLTHSDGEHPVTLNMISDHLFDEYGIMADRRSLYRDIAALEEIGMEIEGERLEGGYQYRYINPPFEYSSLRLIAECIRSAKFISDSRAEELVQQVSDLSCYDIKEATSICDRVKTTQRQTVITLDIINAAIDKVAPAFKKPPHMIEFQYLTRKIDDLRQAVARHGGEFYKITPYQLVIDNGYYYLIGYDSDNQQMRVFRVDRMRRVNELTGPKSKGDGLEEFRAMDMKNYLKRVFNMFGGERKTVSMICTNGLLDTMVDRFGLDRGVSYKKIDDDYFRIEADIEVSPQFFGWIMGFGTAIKIESEDVAAQYKAYIEDVMHLY